MLEDYDYKYTVPGNPRPQLRHRVRHIPGEAKLIRYKAKMLRTGGEVKGFYLEGDGRCYIYTPLPQRSFQECMTEVNPETIKMIGKFGFSSIYDDPKSKEDKERIKMLLRREAPTTPLDCALKVDVVFHMPRPKSHYGTGRNASVLKPAAPTICHTKKPDIDNLRKLLMDALTGILWKDDCIICQGEPIKRYSANPRTEIYIKVLSEETEREEQTLWPENPKSQ